jgi:hypothetical protein
MVLTSHGDERKTISSKHSVFISWFQDDLECVGHIFIKFTNPNDMAKAIAGSQASVLCLASTEDACRMAALTAAEDLCASITATCAHELALVTPDATT